MKESEKIRDLLKILKSIGETFVFKTVGTSYTKLGIPDIIGCYKGKFFVIEFKLNRTKRFKLNKIGISELQEYRLEEIKKAGGITLIVIYNLYNKCWAIVSPNESINYIYNTNELRTAIIENLLKGGNE